MKNLISLWRIQKFGYKLFLKLAGEGDHQNLATLLYERALLNLKFAEALESLILSEAKKCEQFRFECTFDESEDLLLMFPEIGGQISDEEIINSSLTYQSVAIKKYETYLTSVVISPSTKKTILFQLNEMLNCAHMLKFLDETLMD